MSRLRLPFSSDSASIICTRHKARRASEICRNAEKRSLELFSQRTTLLDPTLVHISYCICSLPHPIVAGDPETATVLTGEREKRVPFPSASSGDLLSVSSLYDSLLCLYHSIALLYPLSRVTLGQVLLCSTPGHSSLPTYQPTYQPNLGGYSSARLFRCHAHPLLWDPQG